MEGSCRNEIKLSTVLPTDSVLWSSDAFVMPWSVVWGRCLDDTDHEENTCAGCQVLLIPTQCSLILFKSGGIHDLKGIELPGVAHLGQYHS